MRKRRAKTATIRELRNSPFRTMPRVKATCVLALIGIVLATPALGKDKKKSTSHDEHEYAVMIGTVYGKDQRPLYGAKIRIRRLDQKKGKYELISDHNGEFAQRVPPGPADYLIWIDRDKGSEPAASQAVQTAEHGPVRGTNSVRVHIEKDERVDIGLHPEQ